MKIYNEYFKHLGQVGPVFNLTTKFLFYLLFIFPVKLAWFRALLSPTGKNNNNEAFHLYKWNCTVHIYICTWRGGVRSIHKWSPSGHWRHVSCGQEAWSFPLVTGSLRTYFKTKWEHQIFWWRSVQSMWNDSTLSLHPHQCFCKQLCPVFCGELQRFWLLASAFAECEVELCALTLSHWTDTTDVSIRPLEP